MRIAIAFITSLFLFLTSCMTKHASLDEYRSTAHLDEMVVRQLDYDAMGLPLISAAINRPAKSDERFTVLLLERNHPLLSFDIIIVEQKPDLKRPVKAVYTWTGRGFEWGVQASQAMLQSLGGVHVNNAEDAALALAIAVAPLPIGTAAGFVIGIADGIKDTFAEAIKVVVNNREQIVSYTVYSYDALNRLMNMRMYTADGKKELVRTEFAYSGDRLIPDRTTVRSFVEDKVRMLESNPSQHR